MRPAAYQFVAFAAFGLAALSSSEVRADDKSVEDRLDASDIKYSLDSDGDYKVVYDYSTEGRTQLVFVSGRTETVNGLTIREVFSPAARVEKHKIDGDRALELLGRSSQIKLGSWEKRGDVIYLVIKIIDNSNASELVTVMDIAAETADDMEIELTGGEDEL